MTPLQTVLLCLTIPATLYQLLKISQIAALVNRYGNVRILPSLWFGITLTIVIQVLFALAMTGDLPGGGGLL